MCGGCYVDPVVEKLDNTFCFMYYKILFMSQPAFFQGKKIAYPQNVLFGLKRINKIRTYLFY